MVLADVHHADRRGRVGNRDKMVSRSGCRVCAGNFFLKRRNGVQDGIMSGIIRRFGEKLLVIINPLGNAALLQQFFAKREPESDALLW